MTMKYTPGPWRNNGCVIFDSDHVLLATVHEPPPLPRFTKSPAYFAELKTRVAFNARLIAAAPELLAALKERWAMCQRPVAQQDFSRADEMASAAIAKAEGEGTHPSTAA